MRKIDTKNSPMWPWNSDEGGDDKQAQKQAQAPYLQNHHEKNRHTISETFLQTSFCLRHLGKTMNEPWTSALIGW